MAAAQLTNLHKQQMSRTGLASAIGKFARALLSQLIPYYKYFLE